MELKEFVRIVRRRWTVVVAVGVLVIGSAAFFVSNQSKLYRAQSTVALFPDPKQPNAIGFYDTIVKSILPTYAHQIRSVSFLDGVAKGLPFPTTGQRLKSMVHADPVGGAGVLNIVAQGPDPIRDQQVAAATTAAFVQSITADSVVVPKVIDDARVPDTAYSPKPKLVLAAAIVLGLFLGVACALALERLFGRIEDAAELAAAAGLPVLGVIPEERALTAGQRVVVGDLALARVEEAVRTLRTNVLFAMNAQTVRSLVITGLNPKDGKSTLAANLAVTATELGFEVLLIDGDIHRPTQHEIFGLDNHRGLTSTVLDGAEPASLPQTTLYRGLRVVTAGPPLTTRSQEVDVYLAQLHRFSELADLVIVDSPPLQAAADIRLLAASAGAVVLLVRAGTASARQIAEAVDSLVVLDAPVLGVVLSRAKEFDASAAQGYYKYRRPSDAPAPVHE